MKLDLAGLTHLRAAGPFALPADHKGIAGISGGRTSALMAALLDERVTLCFQNTGLEHEETLVFLEHLQDALGREIVWLEWRPPPARGGRPKNFRYEKVSFQTATRGGELFRGLLECLAEFRRMQKGITERDGKIAPHQNLRICTSYLKHRVQRRYAQEVLGFTRDDLRIEYAGLRADEPARVSRRNKLSTSVMTLAAPLSDAQITKADVYSFWRRQSFDLGLEHSRQGNCGGCFLKSDADLSRVLGEEWCNAQWWIDIQKDFPGFGGTSQRSYAELLNELPTRLKIAKALQAGQVPVDDGRLNPKRFLNVVKNERMYLKGEIAEFSCACESSLLLGDENDDDEDEATSDA